MTFAAVTESLDADRTEIGAITDAFFGAFTSGPDLAARLDGLRDLFLPAAVIVKTCGGAPTVYDVDGFIAPRLALLSSGALVDFSEWETSGETQVWGDIAQRFGRYAKAWTQNGARCTGRGMKTLQFVRTPDGWRISAAAWDDERDGLLLAERREGGDAIGLTRLE